MRKPLKWTRVGFIFPKYIAYGNLPSMWEVHARGVWKWRRWAVIFAGIHPLYLKYGSYQGSGVQVRELGEFNTFEEAQGYCESVCALVEVGSLDPFTLGKLYR